MLYEGKKIADTLFSKIFDTGPTKFIWVLDKTFLNSKWEIIEVFLVQSYLELIFLQVFFF